MNLPEKDLAKIETLIKAGEYTTKSEFVRFAVKQLLYSEERMTKLETAASGLQRQTKSRKQLEREVEAAKAETRRILGAGKEGADGSGQRFERRRDAHDSPG